MPYHDGISEREIGILVSEKPSESASEALIRGIAALKETNIQNLEALYESIDPELMDGMIKHSREHACDVSVEFTYEGYTILIREEEILITDSSPNA